MNIQKLLSIRGLILVDAIDTGTAVTILVVVFCILAIFVLILASALTMGFQRKNKELNNLKTFQNDRIFIVNYKDNNPTVDYFDFNDLRKITTVSYADFLNFFSDSDQNDVKTFINSLFTLDFDPMSKDSLLITNLIIDIRKKKLTYRSILKCNAVDKNKRVLYLSLTRLMNTPVEHRVTKKNTRHDIYDLGLIKKMYDEGRFNKGTMHVFRFFVKPNTINFYNQYQLRRFVIDALYRDTNNNVSCFFYSADVLEFSILDLRTLNDYQLSRFIFEAVKRVEKFLEVRGLSNFYDFNVCSSQVTDLPLYYDDAYAVLSNLFKTAKEINRRISIYKAGSNETSIIESTYKVEIERIIKHKQMSISFAPIVHITNSRVSCFAYSTYVSFTSNLIDNNVDVIKYAEEFNLSSELMTIVVRKIIPTFLSQSQNNNYKLIIFCSLKDLDCTIKAIKNIAHSEEAKIIFAIPNVDLIDAEEKKTLELQVMQVKKQGYNLGIVIRTGDYILRDATYRLFDYYFVDPLLEANVKQDSRSFIKFKSLYDKLAKIGAPIICFNASSFQSIELLSKTGIRDFSNDVISKKDPMLLPVDPKIHKKLLTMVK